MILDRTKLPNLTWVAKQKDIYPDQGALVVARLKNGVVIAGRFRKDDKNAPYGRVGCTSFRMVTDYIIVAKSLRNDS